MKEYASIVFAVFALLILTPTSARADSFTTFTVTGTFQDNTTLSGTFTLDTTTGAIAGFDLVTANDTFTPANSTADVLSLSTFFFPPNTFYFFFENDTGGVHSLSLVANGSCSPIPLSGRCVPVGFNGGNLIPQPVSVFGIFGSGEGGVPGPSFISEFDLALTRGSVTTPEPSSLMLLGTGLLGALARAWRRRIVPG